MLVICQSMAMTFMVVYHYRCLDINECNGTSRVCYGENATCVNTPGSFQCTCGSGYRLKIDGVTCEDINECAERSVTCEQQCVNTNGTYRCDCYEGYNMTSKGKSPERLGYPGYITGGNLTRGDLPLRPLYS